MPTGYRLSQTGAQPRNRIQGGSAPAGGTGGVRPGGRGDRRRSGGNADHSARRSRRRAHLRNWRPRPAVIGGRRENNRQLAAWRNVRPPWEWPNSPTANAAGARVFRGGGAPPRQPRCSTSRRLLTDLKSGSQPSAEPPKPPLGAPPGTASTGPSQAGSPASRSPTSRTARTYPGASATGHGLLYPTVVSSPSARRRLKHIRKSAATPGVL